MVTLHPSSRMLYKASFFSIILSILVYSLSIYYSDKNISERKFSAMLDSGNYDLKIIDNYLSHHDQKTDSGVDTAIQIAATLDDKYLDLIAHYYAIGNLLINTTTANLILRNLPSVSVELNYAAGRIYASNEFNHQNLIKAVEHLEYAALRGNKNAAAELSMIYTKASCYIEAITWAKVANKRSSSSECTKLPVNINLLSDKEWENVIYNEEELETAEAANRISVLRYSELCKIVEQ